MNPSRLPSLDPSDRRLNVAGYDKGAGRAAKVVAACADLRAEPAADCPLDHQLVCGDPVAVFETREGWVLVQSGYDNYAGWTSLEALSFDTNAATHVVHVPRTFAYPGPDLKLPASRALSMGSSVTVIGETETRGATYALLDTGEALFARHLRLAGEVDSDYIAVGHKLIGTPYLWGGTTGFGVDCSGFIQLAMRMCGRAVLRDSDMQAATIGREIDPGEDLAGLERGDLVFWRGHVGIVEGDGNLLHASGYSMDVTSEPLEEAIARIERFFERPIGYRRPQAGIAG
ncbi:MAG: NlpC/P60 family protein [Salaquimonas sp.]|jgi:cell wall-associated NlpC family hydrolase|nr:NlpC/P60 family protein [Salaquimonas sp.]